MSKQKKERLELNVTKRDMLGKKVKSLRREGKLPGNIFGEEYKSTAVTVDGTDFSKIFRHAGETTVVYLHLDKDEVPVLVQNIHKHPIDGRFLHIDFRKVNLNKKIEAQVPVLLSGKSEAVEKKNGVLLTLADSLTVEALPDKLPDQIEIDITSLVDIDNEIKVSDLAKNADYEFKDEPEKVIVRVSEHKEEELTPQVEVEAPAEGEEGAEEEAVEGKENGDVKQEGENKGEAAQESKKEDKPTE